MLKKLNEIAEPLVTELGYELYYLEYVKEDGENYLRIYIDSDNGISLEDCEKVSRKISAVLDESDPITDAYFLEVSSPGIERGLFTDKHLEKYINFEIVIKLSELFEGKRSIQGKLMGFDSENLIVKTKETELSVPRKIIKSTNLWVQY
ncbi:MAG: ribosome maturation factor RimP [Solirubrobacterales bacterium]